MSIRRATFGDLPRLTELFAWAHEKSIYADMGEIDPSQLRQLLANWIKRHGGKYEGATWAVVSEHEDRIEGVLLGHLERVYIIGNKLRVTDLFWVCTPDAPPRDAWKMYRSMLNWAGKNELVVEAVAGTTGAMGDYRRAGNLLLRNGFSDHGAIYRKDLR